MAVKCLHRWWDTMKRKKRWTQVQSSICILCEEKIESCNHVLQCEATRASREIFLGEINTSMKQLKTNPLLHQWMMIMIKQWTRDYKLKLSPARSNLSILRKIRRAITDQMNARL